MEDPKPAVLKSVEDLYERAGGSVNVAALLKLNQWTVDRWKKTGIPHRHWVVLIRKYGTNIAELHTMTEKARRKCVQSV